MQTGREAQRKAFPSGGRCPSAHTGADEGAIDSPNGAGGGKCRGDRLIFLQGKVGYRIAPSSVTFGDSFPPRGSLRRRYTPATKSFLAHPLLPQNANPNQGTQMGTETAPPPEQCATTAKTSEWERAGHKPGGGGGPPPRLFASGLSLRESLDPRPGPGGNPRRRAHPAAVQKGPPTDSRGPRPHLGDPAGQAAPPGALRPEVSKQPRPPEGYPVPHRAPARDRAGTHLAGPTLRRSQRDHLPMTEGLRPCLSAVQM